VRGYVGRPVINSTPAVHGPTFRDSFAIIPDGGAMSTSSTMRLLAPRGFNPTIPGVAFRKSRFDQMFQRVFGIDGHARNPGG
jgi:hypothetical protein